MSSLSWVEINSEALQSNIQALREKVSSGTLVCACVKANAYGHGLVKTAEIFVKAGSDWLAVNALFEAETLRKAGIKVPIYIMGYVPEEDFEAALNLDCRMVFYNEENLSALNLVAEKLGKTALIHLKIETGNNRQGLEAEAALQFIHKALYHKNIHIEGVATHFANIEDTENHLYAEKQLNKFETIIERLRAGGLDIKIRHCGNSAATILFPETHMEMVRPGLACYGMYPSIECKKYIELTPALTWKSRVAQIKWVEKGESIGYGCTYRTEKKTKLAIIPVGYYDGYDRGLSNKAEVLINGSRAKIVGRVCMNIVIADVTEIPGVKIGQEVVLLGGDGLNRISAEEFAAWAQTINYEVTTRINDRIPRIYV